MANVTHSRGVPENVRSAADEHSSVPLTLPAENLAIMFTDIVGFTAKTSQQSREENARMMTEHDRLVLPIIKAFGGRRIKSIGDALLVTFRSPTNCILSGMAIQDRLAVRNSSIRPEDHIVLRIAINIGEVRVDRGDIFGEPVNVASRLEGQTPPGEIWFTEAVYLSMNRSEVHAEEVGLRTFKGVPDAVKLYRVPCGKDPHLPFGGAALARMAPANPLVAAVASMGAWVRRMREASVLVAELRRILRSWLGIALALTFIVLAGGIAWVAHRASNPVARAEQALRAGAAQQALRELGGVQLGAEADVVKGRALHALKREDEGIQYYQSAAKADARILSRTDVLSDLCEDLGGSKSQEVSELLERSGERAVPFIADAARDAQNHRKRWAAIELLRRMRREDKLDLFAAYIADLKSGNCANASKAARSLGEMGDKRAIEPLRAAAAQKRFGIFDSCEAGAAKAALRKLEKPGAK